MSPARVSRAAAPVTGSPSANASWYAAFLRGVNVGGVRVSNADLKTIATALGYTAPATVVNSGNLVFRASSITAVQAEYALHEALRERLGARVAVFVRSQPELETIVAQNPMPQEAASNGSRFLVTLWDRTTTAADLAPLVHAPVTDERFVATEHAVYHWFPHGLSASPAYEKGSRAVGDRITGRNWNTMTKMLQLMTETSA